MKYILIMVISFLFVSLGYNYYQFSDNTKLIARISSLHSDSDTIFVEGIKDTAYIKRIVYKRVLVKEKTPIDTTINLYGEGYGESGSLSHIVKIKTDGKDIDLELTCLAPEVIISKTDTVKIPVLKEILVPEERPFYDNFVVGYVSGTVLTIAVAILANRH